MAGAPPESRLLLRIRESVIGDDQVTWGPFGPRRVTAGFEEPRWFDLPDVCLTR